MSQITTEPMDQSIGKAPGKWTILLLVGLFILALAIRLYDITDLPFDFHPTRQLYTAVVARGLYYQSQPDDPAGKRVLALDALRREEREPPSIDGLAALSYELIGKEVLWLPRAMSAIFWVLGGIAVFLLSRQLTSDTGGVAATAVYLFLPYGVIASRSFQPDPLMTALIVFSWWGIYNWMNRAGWRWVFRCGHRRGAGHLLQIAGSFLDPGSLPGHCSWFWVSASFSGPSSSG